MISKELSQKSSSIPPALWALTISAFAIGTTEFVIVGLVPSLAKDLGITISKAGSLVSMYAMGVAIGAPILTALTSKIKRKPLLISLMLLFIIGHFASAFAPSYELLLLSRFITGFAHGVFFGVGSTIAASLVSVDRRASSIAMMFSGFTVATIIGVPLGTYVGQQWGWRATFIGVAILGIIGLIGVMMLLPANIKHNKANNLLGQIGVLTNPKFLVALMMTVLGYGGVFVAFAYISPILQQITGFRENTVSVLLLLYGFAVAVGNLLGGKLSNKKPFKATVWIFIFLLVTLAMFFLTAHYPIFTLANLFILGGLSFATVPATQLLIVQIAEEVQPEAVDFASAVNIAGFNIGIAFGAWTGGLVVSSRYGLEYTPLAGAIFLIFALGFSLIYNRIGKQNKGKK